MTRGPPPLAAIRDAKKFASKMDYSTQENTENPDLGYDFLAFKQGNALIVKVRVVRTAIGPDVLFEEMLAGELRDLIALPFPEWIPREIWLRTQHERTFRRLRLHDTLLWEIGFWTTDEYVNPHAK